MIKVNITQDHITNGRPRIHESCPVALACKEHFKNDDIVVYTRDLYVGLQCYSHDGEDHIQGFDTQLFMEPFTIKLTPWPK